MKSCLVVDDSRVVRKIIKRIAKDLGFECTESENGKEACEVCAQAMPDVILLDWNMPEMNGIEFLDKLRAMEGGDKPKVIFCTIESSVAKIEKAIAGGADEYIIKPFDNEIIATKFKQAGLIAK